MKDKKEKWTPQVKPAEQIAREIVQSMKTVPWDPDWVEDNVCIVELAIQVARDEALDEALDRIDTYMRLDKYGSKEEGRYFLMNAHALVRALKSDAGERSERGGK